MENETEPRVSLEYKSKQFSLVHKITHSTNQFLDYLKHVYADRVINKTNKLVLDSLYEDSFESV